MNGLDLLAALIQWAVFYGVGFFIGTWVATAFLKGAKQDD